MVKIGFIVVGVVPILLGLLIIGTAGIKGFNGTGGEETPLYQYVTYVMSVAVIGGLLALVTAFLQNRLTALLAGVLLVLTGLLLVLINPLYGAPVMILGAAAFALRVKMAKK
jgi:hypothetical protein